METIDNATIAETRAELTITVIQTVEGALKSFVKEKIFPILQKSCEADN